LPDVEALDLVEAAACEGLDIPGAGGGVQAEELLRGLPCLPLCPVVHPPPRQNVQNHGAALVRYHVTGQYLELGQGSIKPMVLPEGVKEPVHCVVRPDVFIGRDLHCRFLGSGACPLDLAPQPQGPFQRSTGHRRRAMLEIDAEVLGSQAVRRIGRSIGFGVLRERAVVSPHLRAVLAGLGVERGVR
jgi:hypothetical protein